MPKISTNKRQNVSPSQTELQFAGDNQIYGRIITALGMSNFKIACLDGKERIGKIRGTMKRKKGQWLEKGDLCLLSLRDFQDSKVDILCKYTADEARRLKSLGKINFESEENSTIKENDCLFDFENI